MIKILFFDIDGTLLEFGKKKMHQELVDALNLVKKKGIKIILATGINWFKSQGQISDSSC